MRTPICTLRKLDKDQEGTKVDAKSYRDMIDSFLYLLASRPDITFVVCLCAGFQSSSRNFNLIAVKRILRQLKCTIDYGL